MGGGKEAVEDDGSATSREQCSDCRRTTRLREPSAFTGSKRFEVGVIEKPARWLARYRLFQVSTQILEDFLLASLDFKENRFRNSRVVLPRMDFARLQEDAAEIANALLRD